MLKKPLRLGAFAVKIIYKDDKFLTFLEWTHLSFLQKMLRMQLRLCKDLRPRRLYVRESKRGGEMLQ